MTGTVDGHIYEFDIIKETMAYSNGYLKNFSVYLGDDNYGESIVEPFGPIYSFDRTEIQNMKFLIREGLSGFGGAIRGGTAAEAVRRGSSAMAKGAFKGGVWGIAMGAGLEVLRGVIRRQNIKNSAPTGYVSAEGIIITNLA